jgi:hypothetical protein
LSRGLGRAIERTGVGFFDVLTFPLPSFEPLMAPEYISMEKCTTDWRYGDYYEVGTLPCPAPAPPIMPFPAQMNPFQPQQMMMPPMGMGGMPGMSPYAPEMAPRPMMMQQQAQSNPTVDSGQVAVPRPINDIGPKPVTYPDDYLE